VILLRRDHLRDGIEVDALYGRPGPLVLEIGFGDGRYLAHLARMRPDWNLLGVEVSLASVSRAFRRMRREGVHTVRIHHGNARFVVRDVLTPSSLHRVIVNFPDPWPRKRHEDNRLLRDGFFRLLSARLEPQGRVLLTTDHAEYFEFACGQAESTGLFDAEEGDPPDGVLDTKYAEKWKAERRSIRHVAWTVRRSVPPPEPHQLNLPMQHALLAGDLDGVGGFVKQVRRFEGGTAIVTEAFRSLGGDGLLFTVVVEEPDLRQELLVKAWPKEDGVYVGMQAFGDPLGTRGVREAVRAVVDWLVGQGLELRESWI
jgi:tRNA (guanine-N7-)-methyltransferase